jgi:hypothetical protein
LVVTGGAQTIEFADGTVSAPSITNSGDTNTGIYFPAADTIAFTEGGVESMRIDSSGNVGIGVTPTAVGNYKVLQIRGGSTDNGGLLRLETSDGTTGVMRLFQGSGVGSLEVLSNLPLVFKTNDTERMRIASAGNVGIGTSSPGNLLHVATAGTGNSELLRLEGTSGFASGGGIMIRAGSAGTDSVRFGFDWNTNSFQIQNGSTNAATMTVNNSGNVGIGTSSPGAKLDVFNATATEVRSMSSTTSSYANFIVDVNNVVDQRIQMVGFGSTASGDLLGIARANNGFIAKSGGLLAVGTRGSNALVFGTNEAERMRIDSSGNLLVGTTSQFAFSTSRLAVAYNAADFVTSMQNPNGNPFGMYIKYSGAAPNGSSNEFIYCHDGTLRFSVKSNGGISNYSANNTNLSDERTKKDIVNAGNYLDKICAIPVRTFLYKDQTDTQLNLGVIAQEVESVAPELVDNSGFGDEKEGEAPLKAIYQTDLQYALMKCIQEQQAIITQLQADVAALKGAA